MSKYPVARLGTFLRERKEFITIDDFETYKRAKIQWYGKGTILRDLVPGSEIKTKKQQVVRTNEFVVAEIDAKDGSFGVIPKELDGAIVSSHYFVYEIDESICLPAYLEWYIRTNNLQSLVTAKGSTNYSAIRSYTIYDYEIPLPPVEEQRRIVERIESLASRIEEAQSLREEADEEASVFIASLSNQVLSELNAEEVSLGSAVIRARNGFGRRPKTEEKGPIVLRLADVSTGKISLANPRRIEMTDDEFQEFEVKNGDIIFVRVNGSLPIVGRCIPCDIDFQEKVAYNDHLIRARVDINKLYSRYATLWLNSPDMRKLIQTKAVTTAGQYSISQSSILSLPIKLPPLDEQRRIVAYLDSVQARLASLRELQSATGEELSALLPSVLDRAFKGDL